MPCRSTLLTDLQSSLKDPDKHIVKISPALAIGLPAPDFYRDAGLVREYRSLTAKMLDIFYDVHLNSTAILGRHRSIRASSLDLAQGVVDMEVKLALALPLPEDLTRPSNVYHEIPINKTGTLVPQLDFEKIIKDVSPLSHHPDTVVVPSTEYLQRLSFVLAATPVEVIQAFMSWKVIQQYADNIADARLEPLKQFKAKVKGAAQNQPHEPWRHCVRDVNYMLGWAMSRFYVQKQWDNDRMEASETTIGRVQDAFKDAIRHTNWVADDDKEIVLEKASRVDIEIGYPDKNPSIESPSSLEKYYGDLKLGRSHFANKLQSARFQTSKKWTALVDKKAPSWSLFPDVVDSYADASSNKIVLPAGLLQPPMLLDGSIPSYMTYGTLGVRFGHEITHSNVALDYNYSKDTQKAFEKKAKCLAEQYSKFTVDGPNKEYQVNGNFTLNENFADVVGLHVAFQAWRKVDSRHVRNLPGLQRYSKDQLFFISYGTGLCSKTSPEKAAQRILTDTFAPKPARILVSRSIICL